MQTLFIATPSYDGWFCVEFTGSLAQTSATLAGAGVGVMFSPLIGNPFLDLARNELVAKFLESDATDLLFVDADVGWDPNVIGRLLSHPQEIVGGLVPKRDPSNEACFHHNALTGVVSPEGLFQSKELPTAFMRIKRSAFERLEANGVGTAVMPFFKIGSRKEDFGEDIYFNRRWIETGEFLWVDSDITFTHRGGKAWKGNFFDYAVKSGMLQSKAA